MERAGLFAESFEHAGKRGAVAPIAHTECGSEASGSPGKVGEAAG